MQIEFTKHAMERLEERKLLREDIAEAVRFPERVSKRCGLYYFQKKISRGRIEAVCEKTRTHLKVISLYWI